MKPFASVVVSDLHIGSPFFQQARFHAFLDWLHPQTQLILNGDTLDQDLAAAVECERSTLERLWERAQRGKLIWIYGNHDNNTDLHLPPLPPIKAQSQYQPAAGVLVRHGNEFDHLMPRVFVFLKVFRLLHNLRTAMGAPPVHVAQYAKKWLRLYRVLRRSVAAAACRYAGAHGLQTIICGHVHYPELVRQNGICYINAGCWTETPSHFVGIADNGSCELRQWPEPQLTGASDFSAATSQSLGQGGKP